jgi:hypothetical protein
MINNTAHIKTVNTVRMEFLEELGKLVPDIIRNCLVGNESVEAEYSKRLEMAIEKSFRYVSDFKYVLEWMGLDTDFLNQPPYNQNGGYSWVNTLATLRSQEECRRLLDHIINKIIEIDCNCSVKRYEGEQGNLGGNSYPY